MGFKRYPRHTVFCGHGIAEPNAASPWSAERHTRVAPDMLDDILGRLGPRGHLTFDDGYLDNVTEALAILERHARPALIFVTTCFVTDTIAPMEAVVEMMIDSGAWQTESRHGDPARYQHETLDRLAGLTIDARRAEQARLVAASGTTTAALTGRYVDSDGLRALAAHPLITIGAHTRSHPDLRRLNDADLADELTGARHDLETWLEQPIESLAYPYGFTDARVRQAARRAGYRAGYIMSTPSLRSRWPILNRLDRPRIDLRSAAARLAHRRARHGDTAAVL